jgi:hypothetical protein
MYEHSTPSFSADFNVHPSPDGGSIVWALRISREQFDAMVNSTTDRAERVGLNALVHEKIRALIAAGLQSHSLFGCRAEERAVAELKDGAIAFLGSCPIAARAAPAGGV